MYLSPGIIAVIQSIMRGVRPVTRTGELNNTYKFSVLKPEGEIPLGGSGVFERTAHC